MNFPEKMRRLIELTRFNLEEQNTMQTIENDFDHVSQFVSLESVVRNVAPRNGKYLYDISEEECQFQRLESGNVLTSIVNCLNPFQSVDREVSVVARENSSLVAKYRIYKGSWDHKRDNEYQTKNCLLRESSMGFKPSGESLGTGFYDLAGKLVAKVKKMPLPNITMWNFLFKKKWDNFFKLEDEDTYFFDYFRVELIDQEKEYSIRVYANKIGTLRSLYASLIDQSGISVMAGRFKGYDDYIYINRYDDNTEILFIVLLPCLDCMQSFYCS